MKEPIVPTPIMLQRMLKDGVSPDGSAIQIFDRTAEDGPLVEAPDIVRSKEGIYFLFFSSGCTRDESYVSWTLAVRSIKLYLLTLFRGHQIRDLRRHYGPVCSSFEEASEERRLEPVSLPQTKT